jgi:lysophospholipase L1-like esterase
LIRKLLLSSLSVALVVATVAVGDRIYGHFIMGDIAQLVYPPYSRAHHHSAEFDLTVKINNLGFRGPVTAIQKTKKRVLFIGDSFTFGWGVEDHETWVQLLQAQFPELELLNLGRGGTHPGEHVQLARRVVPVLKPDLVIMGVLQGNDLHQLMRLIAYERGEPSPVIPTVSATGQPTALAAFRSRVFPYFSQRFQKAVQIDERWAEESKAILGSFSAEDAARYALLDPEVRHAFESAKLNPSLIFEAIHHPDAFRTAADTGNGLLRDAMVRLRDHLSELDAICTENGVQMIALSLPNRPYGCHDCVAALQKVGYAVDGCDTLDADLPFRWAAANSGVKNITLGDSFDPRADMFFPLDGHWNANGNRSFALSLIDRLKTDSTWNSLKISGNF